MTRTDRNSLIRLAIALTAVASLSGCAARFDRNGDQTYVWQYGQDFQTTVDYSNPRLPILPKGRPVDPLWDLGPQSPPLDLSEYALLAPLPPSMASEAMGDNGGCAIACDLSASGATVVARADVRGNGRASAIR